MKRKPELANLWINPLTGDTKIAYEPSTPNAAWAIVVCLALTIPFWVLS